MERKLSENAQNPCTVPTQPKTGHLSLDKSDIYKNQLTRSG
jgi:hypothetical protein